MTVLGLALSHDSPWIGTFTGTRSGGFVFAGDVSGGIGVGLQDFWQAYPASLEVRQARSDEASLIVWLWSPEAEAMDLRHYDKVAHDLNASYEDVQEGMSTPYGIARTHTLTLVRHIRERKESPGFPASWLKRLRCYVLPNTCMLAVHSAFGLCPTVALRHVAGWKTDWKPISTCTKKR